MVTTPEISAETFRDQDQVWPVRVIRRGGAVRPLPPHARSLADLTFEVDDVRLSLSDYLARRRTAGLLILKDGEIALERYGTGSGPEMRWQSYSTAKAITSTLVGAALHDGAIGTVARCSQRRPSHGRSSPSSGYRARSARTADAVMPAPVTCLPWPALAHGGTAELAQ